MRDDTISRAAAIDALNDMLADYVPGLIGRNEEIPLKCAVVIRNLPSAQQWIPCSEVPDTDRNVFIARGDGNMMTVCVGHYRHDYKQWYEDRNWFAKCLYDGLYWCEMPPLPEPWKGEQNG